MKRRHDKKKPKENTHRRVRKHQQIEERKKQNKTKNGETRQKGDKHKFMIAGGHNQNL